MDPEQEERARENLHSQGLMRSIGVAMRASTWGCQLRLEFDDRLTQQPRFFHGGVVATLADVSGGHAACTQALPSAATDTREKIIPNDCRSKPRFRSAVHQAVRLRATASTKDVRAEGRRAGISCSSRGRRVVRYALLLYVDPVRAAKTTAAEAERELSAYTAITEDLDREGVLRGGEAFLPEAMASFVGAPDNRQAGVAVAGKDLELSGFYIVACDEEQALEIAARMPVVTHGLVEVRPLMDLPEPAASPDDTSA